MMVTAVMLMMMVMVALTMVLKLMLLHCADTSGRTDQVDG